MRDLTNDEAMVTVPRYLAERIEVLMQTYSEHGMDATYSSGERTPNAIMAEDIAEQLRALLAAMSKEAK